MYNRIDLSSSAIDDKPIYLAFWPERRESPEVWTLREAEKHFGNLKEVMNMIHGLAYYEELYHEESNFILLRIPSFLDVTKVKYQMTKE